MTLTKKSLFILGALAVLAVVYVLGVSQQTDEVLASTIMGNDYMATSTAANSFFGASVGANPTGSIIKTGAGTLASVVIMGANTGVMNFYDATTTNILARTGNTSTSSILIASFSPSATVGTYTLDVEFSTALLLELNTGVFATSTITYR